VLKDLFHVRDGYAFPRNEHLADEGAMTEQHARASLSVLKRDGAIILAKATVNGKYVRVIYPAKAVIERAKKVPLRGGRTKLPPREGAPPGGHQESYYKRRPLSEHERARLAAEMRERKASDKAAEVVADDWSDGPVPASTARPSARPTQPRSNGKSTEKVGDQRNGRADSAPAPEPAAPAPEPRATGDAVTGLANALRPFLANPASVLPETWHSIMASHAPDMVMAALRRIYPNGPRGRHEVRGLARAAHERDGLSAEEIERELDYVFGPLPKLNGHHAAGSPPAAKPITTTTERRTDDE
jgi:hypothetical protein